MAVRGRVSVVVLAFDGGDLLLRAVTSVLHQTHPDVELVVVDNGSTDGCVQRCALPPSVRVLTNRHNEGFARGMNRGIAAATGEVVVPCNQDVVLHRDFAARAVAVLAERPAVGAVAPLVLAVGPNTATVPDSGTWPVDSGGQVLSWDMRAHSDGRDLTPHTCVKASGACPVYRAQALQDVAREGARPFAEPFDTYGEDVDLACRLLAAGWTTWYAPDVRAGHTTSSSSVRSVADKRGRLRVNIVAGRHLNALRHLEASRALAAEVLVLAGDVAFLLGRVVAGDLRALVDVGAAWLRVVRLAPWVVATRATQDARLPVPLALRLRRGAPTRVTLPVPVMRDAS